MKRLWQALAGLPAPARWSILGGSGLILALLLGSGIWAWLGHRETAAVAAFGPVTATYHQAMSAGQEAALPGGAESLRQFLRDYPRSKVAAQAWYFLGNVEYQRRSFDAAITAFEEATRLGSGSVAGLSRVGQGYAWESKGDLVRALQVYRAALTGRDATDFAYGELLLGMARVQEALKQPAGAIESYKRFLQDLPASAQGDEVRARLAILGSSG